jgi:hypothetical protein
MDGRTYPAQITVDDPLGMEIFNSKADLKQLWERQLRQDASREIFLRTNCITSKQIVSLM